MEIKVLASGSSGNCSYINDGKTSLLLDAGIPVAKIRIGTDFRLGAVSGVLITHRHGDHAKSVPHLLHIGLNVYAHDDVFSATVPDNPYNARVICFDGDSPLPFTIGTFSVTPFAVHHDVPNFGFYIHSTATGENLVYFTDTFYLTHTFPALNYLLAECNYDPEALDRNIADERLAPEFKKRLVRSHMSIDTLLEMLKANDLSHMKQIYLMHLSDNNSRAEEFRRRVQAVAGCEVYLC